MFKIQYVRKKFEKSTHNRHGCESASYFIDLTDECARTSNRFATNRTFFRLLLHRAIFAIINLSECVLRSKFPKRPSIAKILKQKIIIRIVTDIRKLFQPYVLEPSI